MLRTHYGKAKFTVNGINKIGKYESAGDPTDPNTPVLITFIDQKNPFRFVVEERFAEDIEIDTQLKDNSNKQLNFQILN